MESGWEGGVHAVWDHLAELLIGFLIIDENY